MFAVGYQAKTHGAPWSATGGNCFCASTFTPPVNGTRPAADCDNKCAGNHSQSCGGAGLIVVGKASCHAPCQGVPAPPPPPPPPPPKLPSGWGGHPPVVLPGPHNSTIYIGSTITCLWNGKCRKGCPSGRCVHDVPNSVNATRAQVFGNGTRIDSTAIVADANWYPDAHEGPNENGIVLLSDERTAYVVMRLGAGDYAHVEPPLYNGYYDYLQSRSTDTGLTWSKPSFIVGAGSAMPSIMRLGKSLVMSGGRNCNNINHTIDGVRRGADLMLWLSADGMAESWDMYSLSYWHNRLWKPNATVSMQHGNCTQRGPNCFSEGVNTSCRTETSAYTALHLASPPPLAGSDDSTTEEGASITAISTGSIDRSENLGWVSYDMHGINFAMEFRLV